MGGGGWGSQLKLRAGKEKIEKGQGVPRKMGGGGWGSQMKLKKKKNNKPSTFCGRKWPVWDPLFDPKIPPKKFMWVPFLRPFPGNEAHKLFSGAQKGGQKV